VISESEAFDEFIGQHRWAVLTTLRKTGGPVSSVIAYARDGDELVISTPGTTFKRVTLEFSTITTRDGYLPGKGELRRDPKNPARWLYIPFEEAKTEKHPRNVNLMVVPMVDGVVVGDPVRIRVQTVFNHLTGVHGHRPGQGIHMPQHDDFELAWRYAKWKYDIDTSNLTTIKYAPDIGAMGLTNPGVANIGRHCRLGQTAFLSENTAASVLGHENVHGGQSIWTFIGPTKNAEIPAYSWEIRNSVRTGISKFHLDECKAWLAYFQGRGPKPKF